MHGFEGADDELQIGPPALGADGSSGLRARRRGRERRRQPE
jgi:hypothetical protein